jgi:hypothetical protein
MVQKVKGYTNLLVIGSTEISVNETALNESCDYIDGNGMYFIVLFTTPTEYNYNPYLWIMQAEQKYGDKFLGVYCYDEPGGNQLDKGSSAPVGEARDYADAANAYVEMLKFHIDLYEQTGVDVTTADYGLFWFDYEAGYNTLLTEFVGNQSRLLSIALCRGAATIQNRQWGAIITWKYDSPPYIESGQELYNDMVLAYQNGAKYVVVFDYPKITQYGVLTTEHFEALQKFWNYINTNPKDHGNIHAKVAYVLPENYGFGFRNPDDTIWGLWKADELSAKIWNDTNKLLNSYGSTLDIVYTDQKYNNAIQNHYTKLYFWNATS